MSGGRVWIVSGLVLAAACGGGGGGGDGGTGPAVFTSLTVSPTTANVLVNQTQALTVTARDQNNNSMSGLSVTYASSNDAVATVSGSGVVTGVSLGTVQITASGTIGSVTKTATATITVAAPGANASVQATTGNAFNPGTATITANGTVTWTFATLHNVTFDTNGSPANIGNTSSGSVARTFPTPGRYEYHCTIHAGMNGSVVVQ